MEMPKNIGVAIPTNLVCADGLKLVYSVTVTCDGTADNYTLTTHPHANLNGVVQIRLKWGYCNKIVKDFKLDCSFSSRRFTLREKHATVEMDVNSDSLKYSKMGICPTECWSEWQFMATMPGRLVTGTTNMYYASCDFHVTEQILKTDMIFTKLYADDDFTDFRLGTTEGSVGVHKACLAAHSDVFKTMLSREWKETTEGKITMEGVNLKILQDLKDYMYLGTVPDEGLRPLLLLARRYLIKELEKQCIRKLAQRANYENLYSLLKFACENNIPELSFATLMLTRESVVHSAYLIKKYKPSK